VIQFGHFDQFVFGIGITNLLCHTSLTVVVILTTCGKMVTLGLFQTRHFSTRTKVYRQPKAFTECRRGNSHHRVFFAYALDNSSRNTFMHIVSQLGSTKKKLSPVTGSTAP